MKYIFTILLATVLASFSNAGVAKSTTKQQYKSPGKPSAKVEMDYSVSKERVAVGETVDISIKFKGAERPALANLKTSKQLVLHGNSQLSMQKASTDSSHSFSVTPMTEGIHIITVVAEDAQQSHKKPFAIRIIAGDKPVESYLKKNGTLTTDEKGEKIISMPAEER